MTIALHTNILSPHQLPFAHELVKLVGESNYRYIFSEPLHQERITMGWNASSVNLNWVIDEQRNKDEARKWLEECDVLVSGIREPDLFARRAKCGRKTFYLSERWFKPPLGMLRLLSPSYFRMARQFVHLIDSNALVYLPIGIHAAQDMANLISLWHCKTPVVLEHRTWAPFEMPRGCQWMRMWGYFVAESSRGYMSSPRKKGTPLRVLWAGRMLAWKNVGTLVRAVARLHQHSVPVELTLVGSGPDELRLRRIAKNLPINFVSSVPVSEVREFMRQHDLYVLPSNGYEGWGAVVSEALEERMVVFGSKEAGSSATLLPLTQQFPCSSYKSLTKMMMLYANSRDDERWVSDIGAWSAKHAAECFVRLVLQK